MMLHSSKRRRNCLLPDFSQLPAKIIALAARALLLQQVILRPRWLQEIVVQQNHEDRTPS